MNYYLGRRIKELRQSKRWSQKDLAGRLNKSVSTISGYESDAHPIPTDVLINFGELFDISLDELLGLEKTTNISVRGLSEREIDIVRRLIGEYQSSTNRSPDLSSAQMKLLHDIIYSFSTK